MDRKSSIEHLLDRAWQERTKGSYARAEDLLLQARQLCEEGDHKQLGRIAHITRQILADQKKWGEAIQIADIAILHYMMVGDFSLVAHARRHLADLLRESDQAREAHDHYVSALTDYEVHAPQSSLDIANARRGFALNLEKIGRRELALHQWTMVRDIYAKLGLQEGVDEAETKLKQL